MRRAVVVLVLLLLTTGCATERVGGPSAVSGAPSGGPSGASGTGPVDLPASLELSRVAGTASASPSTTAVPDASGAPLVLEPPFLRVDRLADARLQFQEYANSWAVVLALTPADAAVFGRWTGRHVGDKVAIVAGGEVLAAPEVSSAATAGDVVISTHHSQDEAGDLLVRITGR